MVLCETKKDKAFCKLCDEEENNQYCCIGGTTGSLIRYLKIIHSVNKPEQSTSRRFRYVFSNTVER
jgi:hypothetical protein